MTEQEYEQLRKKRIENDKERISLAMTVEELIEHLKIYPLNLPVTVFSSEGIKFVDMIAKCENERISTYSPSFQTVQLYLRR